MKVISHLFITLGLIISGCVSSSTGNKKDFEIASRDGIVTYLCNPQPHWIEKPLAPAQDLTDSTLPIASWQIDDDVSLVIHNFPDKPIPPKAQVARWEGQLKKADTMSTSVEAVAWGGFEGLRLRIQDTEDNGILAWAMTLPVFHKYHLQGHPREEHISADWTIKVTGPMAPILLYEEEINAFAASFRLKREIPAQ